MIIAYLMPQTADEPRDGLSFISVAPTQQEAIEKLGAQIRHVYEDAKMIEWHLLNQDELPHVVVVWESEDDKIEVRDFFWLHVAED